MTTQTQINDGGPAFPLPFGSETTEGTQGMSLRAWLAGNAMQGLLANAGGPVQANGMNGWGIVNCRIQYVTDECVAWADAMIASLQQKMISDRISQP